jgi:hypothetical protein
MQAVLRTTKIRKLDISKYNIKRETMGTAPSTQDFFLDPARSHTKQDFLDAQVKNPGANIRGWVKGASYTKEVVRFKDGKIRDYIEPANSAVSNKKLLDQKTEYVLPQERFYSQNEFLLWSKNNRYNVRGQMIMLGCDRLYIMYPGGKWEPLPPQPFLLDEKRTHTKEDFKDALKQHGVTVCGWVDGGPYSKEFVMSNGIIEECIDPIATAIGNRKRKIQQREEFLLPLKGYHTIQHFQDAQSKSPGVNIRGHMLLKQSRKLFVMYPNGKWHPFLMEPY